MAFEGEGARMKGPARAHLGFSYTQFAERSHAAVTLMRAAPGKELLAAR